MAIAGVVAVVLLAAIALLRADRDRYLIGP
jgi:hypothetical protein